MLINFYNHLLHSLSQVKHEEGNADEQDQLPEGYRGFSK